MSSFLLALSFLTIFPVPFKKVTEKEMSASLYFYPLVGLLLGLALWLIARGIYYIDFGIVGSVIIIAFYILLTGGLHVDGLMDTADGIFSSRSAAEKLEIMKDSRVGAMGTIAFVIVVLLKISSLEAMPIERMLPFLILMPLGGRWALVVAVTFFPYARKTGGLGSMFREYAGVKTVLFAGLFFAVTAVYLLDTVGVAIVAAVLAVTFLLCSALSKHLGGLTGDTYGAVCELVETLILLLGVV